MNDRTKTETRPPRLIETERLILRRPKIEDSTAIFKTWVTEEEVTRYMTWKPHKNIEETRTFLNQAITAWKDYSGELVYVIEDKQSAAVMGTIGLRLATMKAELGYCLAPQYWRNGYMTEAVTAIISWGLHDTRLQRIQAVCDSRNAGSAKVMLKSGMKKEASLKRYLHCPNIDPHKLRTADLYAITR